MHVVLRAALASGLYQHTADSGPPSRVIRFNPTRRYEIKWGSSPDRSSIGECRIHDPEDGVELEIEWLDIETLPYANEELQLQPVFTIASDGGAVIEFVNVYTPPGQAHKGADFFDPTS